MEVVTVKTKLPPRALKRKRAAGQLQSDSRRTKRVALGDLPWRQVKRPTEAGLDDTGDIVELEEVEGVEVVYEGDGDFKIAKFNVRKPC